MQYVIGKMLKNKNKKLKLNNSLMIDGKTLQFLVS